MERTGFERLIEKRRKRAIAISRTHTVPPRMRTNMHGHTCKINKNSHCFYLWEFVFVLVGLTAVFLRLYLLQCSADRCSGSFEPQTTACLSWLSDRLCLRLSLPVFLFDSPYKRKNFLCTKVPSIIGNSRETISSCLLQFTVLLDILVIAWKSCGEAVAESQSLRAIHWAIWENNDIKIYARITEWLSATGFWYWFQHCDKHAHHTNMTRELSQTKNQLTWMQVCACTYFGFLQFWSAIWMSNSICSWTSVMTAVSVSLLTRLLS